MKKILLPETTVTDFYDGSIFNYAGFYGTADIFTQLYEDYPPAYKYADYEMCPVIVEWDGKRYETKLWYSGSGNVSEEGSYFVGNGNLLASHAFPDTGEPFAIAIDYWGGLVRTTDSGDTHTFSIYEEDGSDSGGDSGISFGAFLANPKYRFGAFRGLFGWLSTRKKAPILPYGYTQQEYIESDGLYCIDTGYYPNQSTGFYADFIPYNEISGTEPEYGSIFGGRESSRLNEFQLTTYRGDPSFGGTFRYGKAEYNPGLKKGVRTVATFRNGKYSSNLGASFEVTPTEFSSPVPMTLFAVNNGGRIGQCGKVRLFALRFYEGDEIVRNYIPCRNSIGQSGLWDLVTSQFYRFRAPASSYDVGFSESEGPSAG